MRPIQHAVEFGSIQHIALQRAHKNLRGVAKYDDSEGNWKRQNVDSQGHL